MTRAVMEHGLDNVYGEIGTAFANSAVAHPRFSAALIGTLVRDMGADHVIWGTESVFYGSPQWQIEAMRRLEVPEDMQAKYDLPSLGGPNSLTKQAIFGLNAARLYNIGVRSASAMPAMPNFSEDKLARQFREEGGVPSNKRYGYVWTAKESSLRGERDTPRSPSFCSTLTRMRSALRASGKNGALHCVISTLVTPPSTWNDRLSGWPRGWFGGVAFRTGIRSA